MPARTTPRTDAAGAPGALTERTALLGLLLVAVALTWFRLDQIGGIDTPIALDEIGYIGNARHLVGGFPDVVMSGTFYSVGASLLLVPILALTDSPTAMHTAGVVLNVGLLAGLLGLLYALLRRHLGADPLAAFLGAVLAGSVPWLTTNAATLWSETLLGVLMVVWLLGVGTLRPERSAWGPVGFALTSVALYATHPRALGTMGLGLVLLVGATAVRRISTGTLAAALVAFAAAFALTRWLNGILSDALYLGGAGSSGDSLIARLRLSDSGSYLDSALGQVWGLLVSSLGLVVPGVWLLGRGAWDGRGELRRPPVRPAGVDPLVAIAALAALAWALAVTTAQIGTGIGRLSREVADANPRADLLVYTRYLEPAALAVVASGGAWIGRRRIALRERLVVGGVTVALICGTAVWIRAAFPVAWFDAFFSPSNAAVVFSWVRWVGSFSPVRISLWVAVVAGLMVVLPWRGRQVAAVLAVAVSLALVRTGAADHMVFFRDHAHATNDVPTAVNDLGVDEVGFLAPWTGSAFYTYQFWLATAEYRLVTEEDLPGDLSLVIAPIDWPAAEALDARLVASDEELATGLWSLDAGTDATAAGP